jgi:hypothetical protein
MNNKITLTIGFLIFISTCIQAQFILSAEVRPRTEYRDGFKTPTHSEDQAAFFTEQRSRINFDFIDTSYTFRVSLQDVRIWGENNQIFKQENGNTFLSEAWVNYKVANNLGIKAGRQIISYDNQRYFGGLEWAQQGRRHDALLLVFNNKESKTRMDLGFAFNADDDVPEPQNIQSPTAGIYSKNNYKYMQYAWFNKEVENLKLSLLAANLGYQFNADDVSWRQTLGMHGMTKGLAVNFGWDGYYQLGKSGDNDVSAYLFGANFTYNTSLTPITLGVEHISGKDGDDTSSDITNFSPDFGTNHAHNGLMDYFFVGPSNGNVGVTDFYLKTKFKMGKSSLAIHGHQFYTGSKQFDLNNNELSKLMGTEIDIVHSWPIRKEANLKIGYSILFASDTMEALRNRDGDFNTWAWAMFTVKPELFRSKK